MSDRQTIGIYRIAQEACTNVIRHSAATRFSIEGRRLPGNQYEIILTDNGNGLPEGPLRQGSLGVSGMHERAKLLGGELCLAIDPAGGGVTIQLKLPLLTGTESMHHEDIAA